MKSFTAEHAENAESNHSKGKIQKNLIFLEYFHFNSSLRPLRSPRLIFYFRPRMRAGFVIVMVRMALVENPYWSISFMYQAITLTGGGLTT